MADTKISALPSASTPLAGTEVLPIVQSGVTRQVSVANLTNSRAISATQLTLTTGNLIVAAGQGIDFSADPSSAGMTSELFDDYEEGTFTPVLRDASSGNAATASTTIGRYTKIGRMVNFNITLININTTGLTAVNNVYITGLPFTSANPNANNAVPVKVLPSNVFSTTGNIVPLNQPNTAELQFFNSTTSGLAGFPVSLISSGVGDFYISGSYEAP